MAVFPKGNEGRMFVSDDWDGTSAGVLTATWNELDGFEEYTRSNNANLTNYFFFGRSQAISVIGQPVRTINLTGQLSLEEPGQDMLREYGPEGEEANQNLGFMWLYDGANGYAVMVQVGGSEERARAEGGLQPFNVTLAPQDEPVTVADFDPDAE